MAAALGWRLFARSLLVQASWNYTGFQNLGFYFMVWPALARRQPPAQRVRAAQRHLRTFNTHPYFAGLVAAAVIRSEESGGSEDAVAGLERSLMCALGAVGDEFFWAALRPLAAVLALPAALAGALWAPLVLLAVYNVPHLGIRAWGIGAALREGAVVTMLQRRPLSRALPALGTATVVAVGFLVGAAACDSAWGLLPGHGLVSAVLAGAVFVLLLAIQSQGVGQGWLLATLSVGAALAGGVLMVTTP